MNVKPVVAERCCPPLPIALFFSSAKRFSREKEREREGGEGERKREASRNKRNYKHAGRYIQETSASARVLR